MSRPPGAAGTAGSHYRDVVHVPDEDCTEARRPTDAQARAIGLLELNPHGCELVRLTLAQWAHVDRVVAQLAAGVPTPRTSNEGETR